MTENEAIGLACFAVAAMIMFFVVALPTIPEEKKG